MKPRMEKKSLTLALSFLLTLSFLQLIDIPIAFAQTTTLSVDPSLIIDPLLTPGSTFHINITVADVSSMWGFQFVLSYDTSVLTATGYSAYDPFVLPWPSEINDTAGYVSVAYSMMFGEPVGFSTVDPTPIARIEFTVDALGTSVLDLHDTLISDLGGEAIPHEVSDGFFSNMENVHDIAVTSVTAGPTNVTVGEPVFVTVTVVNQGTFNETFDVNVFYDMVLIRTVTDVSLAVGGTTTLNFTWDTTGVAEGIYTITAEASIVAGEIDTADNTFIDGQVAISAPPPPPPPSAYTRIYLPNQWISNGVAMGWHSDDESWLYTLPFVFPFYGTYYTTIYISSNGLITFLGPDPSFANGISELATKLAIAPAWDDWTTWDPWDIYIWQPDPDHVIIRWEVAALYNTSIVANFEVILGSDGVIQFNYGYNNGPISATIGISNGAGDILAEDVTDLNYINSVVFTPYMLEHELEVSLTAPQRLNPGESTTLNATVFNLGQNNETEVDLFLLIDDATASSTTVPELLAGAAYTLSYAWTPTAERTYNITAYAPPVPGENITTNNVQTVFTTVQPLTRIGIIETHGETLHSEELDDLYRSLGYVVEKIYTTITSELLDNYDIIIVGEDWSNIPWLSSEIEAVQTYINSGKGFVAIGDELATSVQQILNNYGISYTGVMATPGSTRNFDPSHPIMQNVNSIYASSPINSLQLAAPAYYIVNDATNTHILIAGAEVGGNVLCLSNDFAAVVYWDDNAIMFRNIAEWMTIRYEHELAVIVDAPPFLPPSESWLVSATVYNRGLANETNVELQLLIDDELVNQTTIPVLLSKSSARITYLWAPISEGTYNITGYAPPVSEEALLNNNRVTKLVTVMQPLIQPAEGQWANYTITLTQKATNTSMITRLNSTYSRYISPYQMNVTLWMTDPYQGAITSWLILNVMSRQVEAGAWAGMWYPLWIETNVTVGSTVRILDTTGTVVGSRFVEVGKLLIDSWELQVDYYGINYLFLFDKTTGVVTGVEGDDPYYSERWELTATNILRLLPVEIDPETGIVGTQVTISGTEATPNGAVEIYWDNDFLGTTTSDSLGSFSYTFTIPPSTRGPHYVVVIDETTRSPGIATFTVVPSISITPTTGPIGTTVQVTGFGFGVNEQVVLSFDDMRVTEVPADEYGSFSAMFSIPLSEPGLHSIKGWYDLNFVEEEFIVIEVTPLEIQVDVGALYFKGETAEFYVQTSLKGVPIDVTSINVTLYKPDETIETLTAQRIATGLYKITYSIKGKGSMLGTYTLVVEGSYSSPLVNATGTSLRTFIVKQPWREWERQATKVALSVATVAAAFGLIMIWRRENRKLNL